MLSVIPLQWDSQLEARPFKCMTLCSFVLCCFHTVLCCMVSDVGVHEDGHQLQDVPVAVLRIVVVRTRGLGCHTNKHTLHAVDGQAEAPLPFSSTSMKHSTACNKIRTHPILYTSLAAALVSAIRVCHRYATTHRPNGSTTSSFPSRTRHIRRSCTMCASSAARVGLSLSPAASHTGRP